MTSSPSSPWTSDCSPAGRSSPQWADLRTCRRWCPTRVSTPCPRRWAVSSSSRTSCSTSTPAAPRGCPRRPWWRIQGKEVQACASIIRLQVLMFIFLGKKLLLNILTIDCCEILTASTVQILLLLRWSVLHECHVQPQEIRWVSWISSLLSPLFVLLCVY